MQTTEPEYTEEQFIKAYMLQDKKTLSRIIKGQCGKRNIQNDDILKAGLSVNTFNRYKKGKFIMKEENLPTCIEILFGEKSAQTEDELPKNAQTVARIHDETGYRCDYEYLMDFGISSKNLSDLRLIKTNSIYSIPDHIIKRIDEEWPDVSVLRDMLTRKPVSINGMMDEIKSKFFHKYEKFEKMFTVNRMSEYLTGKCRMPKKLYDAAIDAIEFLPPLNLQEVPGYMEYRIRILTSLWYEDYGEAQEIFERMLANNPVDFYSIDQSHRRVKLDAPRRTKFGSLCSIQAFDDICTSWYRSISDMTQQRMFFINSIDAILKRVDFCARKGLISQVNDELEGIRSILPTSMKDLYGYADEKGLPSFSKGNLYVRQGLYEKGITENQLTNIKYTIRIMFEIVQDYMTQNPTIQLK